MPFINKIICPILVAALLVVPLYSNEDNCNKSTIVGSHDAHLQYSAGGWWAGGFVSGILLGLIGTGITTGVAAVSNPYPKTAPQDSVVDERCYEVGFKKEAKSKNISSALVGGLVGTLVFVVFYLSNSD